MLSNLDNEVVFKKAFTDKIVFQCFVKDILGIDVQVGKIETEKRFNPKIGNLQNTGIKRAAELIEVTKFTPKQLAAKKSIEQARMAKIVGEEAAIWRDRVKSVKELYANGVSVAVIAASFKQSMEETQQMIDFTAENDRKPFF